MNLERINTGLKESSGEIPYTSEVLESIKSATGWETSFDIVKIEGVVNSTTSLELDELLTGLNDEERFRIVIDMQKVEFVSSYGWWTLIEAQKRCKRLNRGGVVLINTKPETISALDMVGMSDYFKYL